MSRKEPSPARALHDSDRRSASVSVIGLGQMGAALARTFLQKGFRTTVWNRSRSKAEPLTQLGATAADSVVAAIQAAPLVVVCLANHDAFASAFHACRSGNGAIGRDRTLVDFTTGSPSDIRQSVDISGELQFDAHLHGAILVFPQDVGTPESQILYSGDLQAYRAIETVMAALGQGTYLDDDVLSAALHEVMFVTLYYAQWAGFVQALALLRTTQAFKSGRTSALRFLENEIKPLMLASTAMLADMAREVDDEDYEIREHGARIELHVSSLRGFIRFHQEQGLSAELLETIARLCEKRLAQGGQDDEFASLVDVIAGKPRSTALIKQEGT